MDPRNPHWTVHRTMTPHGKELTVFSCKFCSNGALDPVKAYLHWKARHGPTVVQSKLVDSSGQPIHFVGRQL